MTRRAVLATAVFGVLSGWVWLSYGLWANGWVLQAKANVQAEERGALWQALNPFHYYVLPASRVIQLLKSLSG